MVIELIPFTMLNFQTKYNCDSGNQNSNR